MEQKYVNGWSVQDGGLYRRFQFRDFIEAFSFMTKVAFWAEKLAHHPTWTNTYHQVEIWLITHDFGHQTTEKDQALAEAINKEYHRSTLD